MEVRNIPVQWAAAAVVVLLGVCLTLVVWLTGPGLFGFDNGAGDAQSITATVTLAAPCGQAPVGETVTLTIGGQQRQAQLDGCGHREGESLQVAMPGEGESVQPLMVHAAAADTGHNDPRRRLALPLLLLSTFAGAGYAVLIRRGPRGGPWLPARAPRVVG